MRAIKLISILLLSIVIFSCSKDEVVEKQKSLIGTTWEGVNSDAKVIITFYDETSTLTMKSLTTIMQVSATYEFDYTHPVVIMNPSDKSNAVMKGKISDRTMVLENTSTNKVVATLTKKI